MGFSYLGGKNWSDISRDERYYCAELFFELRKESRLKDFIHWLNDNTKLIFATEELNDHWEIGYEVCFYRDFIKRLGDENKVKEITKTENKYSIKRTFDLCLFNENRMVIIEVKSQGKFKASQNVEFKEDIGDIENGDIGQIRRLLGKTRDNFQIDLVALASKKYFENVEKYGDGLDPIFSDKKFSWLQLYNWSGNEVFEKAENVYKK